ncbi:unnamed protein product [Owenia fusiformis]|uniref:Uncharacterized protein n=1 Tax=Owenia fusiformis TaxID=6347 RepID=A0A8S4QAB1_OWEFU|nr:unnamed protein product [Owenia fusiformis]
MKIINTKFIFLVTIAASYVEQIQNSSIKHRGEHFEGTIFETSLEKLGDSHSSKPQSLTFLNQNNAETSFRKRIIPESKFKGNAKKSRLRRATRKSRKNKKINIHAVPVMKSPYALSGRFDLNGNIQCNWTAKSRSNMKLYTDSPHQGSRGSIETYIGIQYTRNYYIYGQSHRIIMMRLAYTDHGLYQEEELR